jgi:hypothetical protein
VRLVPVIGVLVVAMTAIAVGLIDLRGAERTARHEAQRLQLRQVELRRRLWDQQIELGGLTAPRRVREQVKGVSLDLVEKNEPIGPFPVRGGQTPLRTR